MKTFLQALSAVVLLPLTAPIAQTGGDVPVRVVDTGAVVRAATTLRGVSTIRALPDGGLYVHEQGARRLVRFDRSLQAMQVVADTSGESALPYGQRPLGLLPFSGDSTLIVEPATLSLLVLDGSGELRRIMASPRTSDIGLLAGLNAGSYVTDPQGRLVYRVGGGFGGGLGGGGFGGGGFGGGPNIAAFARGGGGGRGGDGGARGGGGATATRGGDAGGSSGESRGGDQGAARRDPVREGIERRFAQQPDSVPIVRASFDTRKTDTAAWLKVPRTPVSMGTAPDGGMQLNVQIDPFPQGDDWALLPDGTIAIVRVLDYHIDYYRPDGTHEASPKLPFDWKRLEDADKARIVDSLKTVVAQLEQRVAQMGNRAGFRPKFEPLPAEKLPDYIPPIRPGSTMADREGNLWILPATSAAAAQQAQLAAMQARFGRGRPGAAGDSATRDSTAAPPAPPVVAIGLIYDVIDRQGRLVERVQLPAGRQLLGFGVDGSLILAARQGFEVTIERAPRPRE